MLTKEQRTLLTNTLDALDRLFDRDSTVWDVRALLFATARALGGSALDAAFETTVSDLAKAVRPNGAIDDQREKALSVTDGLRHRIVEELRRDAAENPRQRHRV